MGERLIYFSSLGFFLIVAYVLIQAEERLKLWKETIWIILTLLILLFGARTILRNEDWLNNDKLYTPNLKNHPEGFLTQLYWATALLGENKLEEGKKHLAAAQKIYPYNPKLLVVQGQLAELGGNYALAEEYYRKALKKYNLSIEAYSKLGHLYFSQERYREAAENLLESISLYPAAQEASYYARTEIQLKTPGKGIAVIHKYFGYNPSDVEVVSALGYSYYIKEDYSNALTYLTKAKELGNISPEVENMIGVSKTMLGQ